MDKWNEKFKEKLGEYQYQEQPSDDKVASFFDRMDHPDDAVETKTKTTPWLRVAASITIFMIAGIALYVLTFVHVATGSGEFAKVELPDGSVVQLKYNSSLAYHQIGWWLNREVEFEGEGFFQVEKGAKFSVKSAAGTTSVLGTSFNIRTRSSRYEVKCFTGRVAVVSGQMERMLTPGQATMFQDGEKVRDFNFDQQTPNWSEGEIHFDNQPLRVVLEELEKVYDVSTEYDDSLETIRYTGFFPTDDLDLALKLIGEPLDLSYKIEGRIISLESKVD